MADYSARPRVGFTGAESHPLHQEIAHILADYRRQAAAYFQAYADLKYAAQWTELAPVELPPATDPPLDGTAASSTIDHAHKNEGSEQPRARWAAIRGRRKDKKHAEYVIPCSLSDTLDMQSFADIFSGLAALSEGAASESKDAASSDSSTPADTDHILLAIAAADSTVVYYQLAKGLVKPVN